jgi:hypothetical protein
MSIRSSVICLSLPIIFATQAYAQTPDGERRIAKEPAYESKAPQYGLLRFGLGGKNSVWLVRDGANLYVDRNGNGDLTEPGEKVAAKVGAGADPEAEGYAFEVGDVSVGGRTHKALALYFTPLRLYATSAIGKRADAKAALAKNPKAWIVSLRVDIDHPELKGEGLGGRAVYMVGPVDLNGLLQFADSPSSAPVVDFSSLLEITFYAELPTLRAGRSSQMELVVGSPGIGPGTFAMLEYEKTIPRTVYPVVELTLPAKKPGESPVKEKFELKGRC